MKQILKIYVLIHVKTQIILHIYDTDELYFFKNGKIIYIIRKFKYDYEKYNHDHGLSNGKGSGRKKHNQKPKEKQKLGKNVTFLKRKQR